MEGDNGHWCPILTGGDADRIDSLLDLIAASLSEQLDHTAMPPELHKGTPIVAAFFVYLCKARRTTRWLPEAARALKMALEGSFSDEYRPTLHFGRSGVIWIAHHLKPDIETANLDRLTQEVEELVLARLADRTVPEALDVFCGLVGYTRFGLDRLDSVLGRQIAREAADRLVQRAEPIDGGLTWWTVEDPRYSNGKPHIRLNLAHGVLSVITILARASKLGMAPENTRAVLDQAVRWLLAQRNPEHMTSRFGTVILSEPDGTVRNTARLAWCWGDLGNSIALHGAAVNLGDCWWADGALELARHAARRPMDDSGVIESGICHGATGAGHIFNRLYQSTREEIFLNASLRWFARALEYQAGPEQVFVQTHRGEESYRPWPTKPGLLMGLAGVGLALLAAISDVEPLWDKVLLIDVPPVPTTRTANVLSH